MEKEKKGMDKIVIAYVAVGSAVGVMLAMLVFKLEDGWAGGLGCGLGTMAGMLLYGFVHKKKKSTEEERTED